MKTPEARIEAALTRTLELTATEWSAATVLDVVDTLLKSAPEPDILAALDLCARTLHRRIRLADIMDRISVPDGAAPLNPEQAWRMAVTERIWDEDVTLVIPRAVLEAFPMSMCNEGRDPKMIAVRQAFLAAYPAKLARYGQEIAISYGEDKAGHLPAIEAAVKRGLLPAVQSSPLIQQLRDAELPDHTLRGIEALKARPETRAAAKAVRVSNALREGLRENGQAALPAPDKTA